MQKIEDLDTASKVASANGAMSYREWAGMHMYTGIRTAIGAGIGLAAGAALGLAFPPSAIALAIGGTAIGAAGGFVSSSMSAVSSKMQNSYISYVNTANEAVEKTRQLNQSLQQSKSMEQPTVGLREGENVDRLKAQPNLAAARTR